jgi:hypothetical protein
MIKYFCEDVIQKLALEFCRVLPIRLTWDLGVMLSVLWETMLHRSECQSVECVKLASVSPETQAPITSVTHFSATSAKQHSLSQQWGWVAETWPESSH